ncbi:DUF3679 domain-containing protein [Bacillaceae bacterium SIJ1]|uniref:DUF3679 domain-containing protein n=1 Tax=Litoribacterium kuwaitense TaxID=1398745 RepID=UPI0013EA2A0B|nr:DUF3679 domain-containing protein [Litoribacterium kuwaitense]NGP43502.1 DUF3679 domain-containing protein [Litoribacterium kuwaitense]
MTRFLLKCFALLTLLLFGVLLGMQLSNEGMNQIKGYDDSSFKEALEWSANDESWEATVLGEEWSEERLLEKQKAYEEATSGHFISEAGAKAGEAFYTVVNQLLRLVTGT